VLADVRHGLAPVAPLPVEVRQVGVAQTDPEVAAQILDPFSIFPFVCAR
jgi:hypothetical protein